MGLGGEDDKLENGSAGGGGFFESFKVTEKWGPGIRNINLIDVQFNDWKTTRGDLLAEIDGSQSEGFDLLTGEAVIFPFEMICH